MDGDSLLEDLFGANTETQQSPAFTETGMIFETGDGYTLIDASGKPLPGVRWANGQPEIMSYVFLKHSEPRRDRLYTIIGNEVSNLDCDRILYVLNFWVIFTKKGQKYIGRLEPVGMQFTCKSQMAIEDCGLLNLNGCAVKIDGEWKVYKYLMHLVEQANKVSYRIAPENLQGLLSDGFTASYLTYLCSEFGVQCSITSDDQIRAWRSTNQKAITVLKKIAELYKDCTASQISKALDLKQYLVSVLRYYISIKNLQDLK